MPVVSNIGIPADEGIYDEVIISCIVFGEHKPDELGVPAESDLLVGGDDGTTWPGSRIIPAEFDVGTGNH